MSQVESPHSQHNELLSYPVDHEADMLAMHQTKTAKQHERWLKIKKLTSRVGSAALIGSAAATTAAYVPIQHDINLGKQEVANSHPSVHEIHTTTDPEKQQVATYIATGMGTRNSTETAQKLTAHHETGNVYAIEYSNREIEIYELTDVIVAHAREQGIKYLSFDGYSAGGPIELAIAAEIHERFDDLHILSVTLNSSPIGEGSLTAQSNEGGQILGTVLQYWPDLAYSKHARLIAEVLARNDQYYDDETKDIDIDALKFEIEAVKHEKINNQQAASGSLIASQINFIYRYLAERNIARLSKPINNKQPPLLFATYSSDPSADQVVNNTVSAANVQQIVNEHFLALDIIHIDNIGHANPSERPTEYNRAIFQFINPRIASVLRIDHHVGGEPRFGENMYILPPKKQPPRLGASIGTVPMN